MFNEDQRSWMKYLASLPKEKKCPCGWDRRGECYNCNRDGRQAAADGAAMPAPEANEESQT